MEYIWNIYGIYMEHERTTGDENVEGSHKKPLPDHKVFHKIKVILFPATHHLYV